MPNLIFWMGDPKLFTSAFCDTATLKRIINLDKWFDKQQPHTPFKKSLAPFFLLASKSLWQNWLQIFRKKETQMTCHLFFSLQWYGQYPLLSYKVIVIGIYMCVYLCISMFQYSSHQWWSNQICRFEDPYRHLPCHWLLGSRSLQILRYCWSSKPAKSP